MRVLFTGGSSSLSARILESILADENVSVFATVNKRPLPIEHPRLHAINFDLQSPNQHQLPTEIDRVIHFAGLTHADDPDRYWQVNHLGTKQLAEAALERGCRSFVYVSTRCATTGSGAYGESKLAAESELRKLNFHDLMILRPAEIYGGAGSEGIDRMLSLAANWHVVPLLFGSRKLRFAPLHIDDFITETIELIQNQPGGEQVVEMCGPADLSGPKLAMRIARKYRALPLPIWWPGLVSTIKLLRLLGMEIVKPDQLARAVGNKTCYNRDFITEDRKLIRFPG